MKLLTIFISEYILYFCVYQLRHPPLNENRCAVTPKHPRMSYQRLGSYPRRTAIQWGITADFLPNPKGQTKLEVCHVVEYSLTAHHLRLFISRKHLALIGHFLHTHYKIAASKLTSLFSFANIWIMF